MYTITLINSILLLIFVDLGCLRHKFCFSIRDSPSDYINITVWGSELYTARLFNSFKMNDIGKFVVGIIMHVHVCP